MPIVPHARRGPSPGSADDHRLPVLAPGWQYGEAVRGLCSGLRTDAVAGVRRVAGAKNQIRLHILTELVPQRRLDIDLGQHAEALGSEGIPDLRHRFGERHRNADGDPVVHCQAAQARARNSFSICSWVIGESPSPVRHCRIPLATILNPARSSARDTAASWVTTSWQSRPSSIIAMTPASWPWARRSRLSTGPADCSSIFISRSSLRYRRIPYGVSRCRYAEAAAVVCRTATSIDQ